MIEYVCVVLFDTDSDKVIMVKKNRPDWQAGKLNFPGGKINSNETVKDAAIRELKEETGLQLFQDNLSHFATIECEGVYRVYFLKACMHNSFLQRHMTLTDEKVCMLSTQYLMMDFGTHCVEHSPVIMRLALNRNILEVVKIKVAR